MSAPWGDAPPIVGRYALYDAIASGGMATVHLGRLVGPVGFSRTVAIKRLHAQFARDPEFVSMFIDEARLAARVQHPNVVQTLDVVATGGELFLVMDYVKGESLGRLVRLAADRGMRVPPRVAAAIVTGALQGLHAAHEATDEAERPLGIVHRDVSPQNILVGIDGVARVLDFGVAKAEGKVHSTRDGQLKGKLLYMSPEQLEGVPVGRATDLYAMGVVLFETLTGERMFGGTEQVAQIARIVRGEIRLPGEIAPDLGAFDAVVRRATAKDAAARFATGRDMILALERCATPASATEVAEWVQMVGGRTIQERARRVAEIESASHVEVRWVRDALNEELAQTTGTGPVVPRAAGAPAADALGSSASAPPGAAYTTIDPVRPPRSRRVIVAAVVAAPLLAMGFFLLGRLTLGASSTTTEAAAAAAAVQGTVEPTAAAPPQTPSPAPAPDPPAPAEGPSAQPSAAQAPEPTGQSAAEAPGAQSAAPHVRSRAPSTSHGATTPRSGTKKGSCAQPYTVDAAGHLHFREECL